MKTYVHTYVGLLWSILVNKGKEFLFQKVSFIDLLKYLVTLHLSHMPHWWRSAHTTVMPSVTMGLWGSARIHILQIVLCYLYMLCMHKLMDCIFLVLCLLDLVKFSCTRKLMVETIERSCLLRVTSGCVDFWFSSRFVLSISISIIKI